MWLIMAFQLNRHARAPRAVTREELEEVYEKFDGSQKGEMREFELARAMNWLGYPLSQSRRRELWCKVDVDKSNKIDCGEFLKLVRAGCKSFTQSIV